MKYVTKMIFADFPKIENTQVFNEEQYEKWEHTMKTGVENKTILRLENPQVTRVFGTIGNMKVMIEIKTVD